MQAIAALSRLGMFLSSGLVAAISVGAIYDVFMRYFLNDPTLWNVEYTGYALAWIGLLAAGEMTRQGEQIRIMLLISHFGPTARLFVDRLSAAVVFLVALVLTVASAGWAWDALMRNEVSDTVLQTPQFYVRLCFPVGMALVALSALPGIINPPPPPSDLEGVV